MYYKRNYWVCLPKISINLLIKFWKIFSNGHWSWTLSGSIARKKMKIDSETTANLHAQNWTFGFFWTLSNRPLVVKEFNFSTRSQPTSMSFVLITENKFNVAFRYPWYTFTIYFWICNVDIAEAEAIFTSCEDKYWWQFQGISTIGKYLRR